jgi:hypothetical protein
MTRTDLRYRHAGGAEGGSFALANASGAASMRIVNARDETAKHPATIAASRCGDIKTKCAADILHKVARANSRVSCKANETRH